MQAISTHPSWNWTGGRNWHLGSLAAWLLIAPLAAQERASMADDIARMVRAAHQVSLMPWSAPVWEIDLVVRHGKAIVPQLIILLPDDPDDPNLSYRVWNERKIVAGEEFDWNVQQQAAVALCRIYRLQQTSCPIYDNRHLRETNQRIRPFWLKAIGENP